jgi:hypothetical protein
MEIIEEFEIIFKDEEYRIKLPQIVFYSEWKNHLADPIRIKIHGPGVVDLVNLKGKTIRKEIGKVKFEIEPEFQIQSNSARQIRALLELREGGLQIFQKEGLLRIQAFIPVTWLPLKEPIEKVFRADKFIRTVKNNSVLEFKLE